jgi:hypothetical protein
MFKLNLGYFELEVSLGSWIWVWGQCIMKIKSNGNGSPSINFTVSNIFSAAALGAQQPESDSV